MTHYEHWPGANVLRRIRLSSLHLPTGRVKHFSEGQLLPPPTELVIARHDSYSRSSLSEPVRAHSNYYIFYLDEHGEELNDDCENTLEDAIALVEAGFGIKPEEWSIIGEDISGIALSSL